MRTDMNKIAIIYENTRPDTTGGYCGKALQKTYEVTHFTPDQMHEIGTGYDLYINIDDSARYLLPERLRPSAFWAIDTHFHYQWLLSKAKTFDYVFVAQKDGAGRFRKDGAQNAVWLPLACDEEIHRKHEVPKKYDICFVGNVTPGGKQPLSKLVRKALNSMIINGKIVFDTSIFTNLLIGQRRRLLNALEMKFDNIFVGNKFFDEMAAAYSESRIVFNRSIKNDINMRVFEALSCGSLLLTNNLDRNGLSELFTDGIHYVSYRGKRDLLKKAAYYLSHEDEREAIARTGMVEALNHHTYSHRMKRLIETCLA